jgi:hypothetical protein
MMINSTTSTDRTVPATSVAAAGQSGSHPTPPRPDKLSTESDEFLRSALSRQPEVRPDVVERAKALAADPSYPSAEILNRVAGLIVNSPDLSEDQS